VHIWYANFYVSLKVNHQLDLVNHHLNPHHHLSPHTCAHTIWACSTLIFYLLFTMWVAGYKNLANHPALFSLHWFAVLCSPSHCFTYIPISN